MSRLDPNQRIMPSVLDRLCDPDAGGSAARPAYSIRQMEEAVLRDLEDLLNTRRVANDVPEDLTEVRNSVYYYGLPDLPGLSLSTSEDRRQIGQLLKTVIERFEPRLRDVEATLQESGPSKDIVSRLRYHIQAKLALDPAPETGFDTILELLSGRYSVEGGEGAGS